MEDPDEDLFNCSTIEIPTVLGLLRNILTQYPDNGQILKELVQNAEDAEATTFEVVYDTRKFTSTKKDLGRFIESPALCAYNDAEFTDKDWQGIRMLSNSIKRKDPVKVGQFGLGFKSVFHFTDYVTIISGGYVLFMDPSEAENLMCRQLPLSKLLSCLPVKNCLRLWGLYLKRHHIDSGRFPGTIFWFPLRKHESRLSSTVYLPSNVDNLFKSFGVEASLCLIFLKSLESICVKKISKKNVQTDLLRVSLSSSSWSETQKIRQEFREQLKECQGVASEPLTCKYGISIKCNTDGGGDQQQYKILHYLPVTRKPSDSSFNEEQSAHMPLVGVAAPLPPVEKDCKGHIFCFLPLPLGTANNTKLPIQINGFFVMDQNRRHVKWKTEESSSEPDVIWNENLVSSVIVDAYQLLLEDVLRCTKEGNFSLDVWYSFLPNIESTDGRWRDLASSIWEKLVQLPVISSEVRKEMMWPKDVRSSAHIDTLQLPIAEEIRKVMHELGLPLATVPENILSSLRLIGAEIEPVNPPYVRDCLRKYEIKTEWNKLLLLEYVISDGLYDELEGLPLLPLKDGSWTSFQKHGEAVYVCQNDEGEALLGIENLLLREELPSGVLEKMINIASEGVMQLKIFSTHSHSAKVLPGSVNYVQSVNLSGTDLEKWLKKVWCLLQPLSLHHFEDLVLIPLTLDCNSSSLISLSSAFVVTDTEYPIPETTIEVLRIMEIQVLPRLPSYIHHSELHKYLSKPNGEGIHQVLEKVIMNHSIDYLADKFNSNTTNEGRLGFCDIISEIKNLKPQVKNFLEKLNLFKAVQGNCSTYVNIAAAKNVFPQISDFPVGSPEPLIKPCNLNVQRLALKLGAIQLTKADLCELALRHSYSDEDRRKLGWYILQDSILVEEQTVRSLFSDLKFIPTLSGNLFKADQLYDPEDTFADVLLGEDMIPDKKYWKYLGILRELGLKSVKNMPKEDLMGIVKSVENKHLSENEKCKKIKTLLLAINNRDDNVQICHEMADFHCVYGESIRPENYPCSLNWATSDQLYKPSCVKSFQLYKYIIGSSVPLIDCADIPHMADAFGWNSEPSVSDVIRNVENIIKVCSSLNGVTETVYYDIMKKNYKHLNKFAGSLQKNYLQILTELPIVITRTGFKFPREMYIPSMKGDLLLEPYIFSLPQELCEYADLFQDLGTYDSQTPQLYLNILEQIRSRHNSEDNVDTNYDLKIVLSLLQELQPFTNEIDKEQLLLPVDNSKDKLELVEIKNCAYSDQDCDWLDSEELDVRVIHSSVSNALAKALGVEPLNKHLLMDEEAVMEWGQHEPLTTRLHNLLREYRDGVAVMKELVQNADDAGASVISFLYDERDNQHACKRLITEQFKECQGPALWAYNNANFTEADFENLCKLGGATKECESTKIGKFGLGFCSVYNITDVPSFVSGTNYVIFDPHQKYLENRRHGVRYNFSKRMNQIMLKKLDGQIQPFCNIFGCKIQETFTFDGTLFRFPFRTSRQSIESKLSDVSYSHAKIIDLLDMFRAIVGEILLYTQNVTEVNVYYLGKNSSPEDMELLYKSDNSKQKLLSTVTDMQMISCRNQVNRLAELVNCNHTLNRELFQESVISDISVTNTHECSQLFSSKQGTWTVTWVTSWHSGTGEALKYAKSLGKKALPLGAVSVPVKIGKNCLKLCKLKDLPCGFYKESHMHCFLPLPVITPLPVQINGFFQVASNRTSLMTSTSDDCLTAKDWNTVLIEDVITAAYLSLVDTLRVEGLSQESLYFSLWPLISLTDDLLNRLAACFYNKVKEEDLRVLRNKNGWHALSKSRFLAESFYTDGDIASIVFQFLGEWLAKSSLEAVELPERYVEGFDEEGRNSVITEKCFYLEYFFPNLSQKVIDPEKQNRLILHVIDEQKPFLPTLKNTAYIPTLPYGNLKKPEDVIDPNSKIGRLYDESDEVFPVAEFLKRNRRELLRQLGMKHCKLGIEMVSERAKTVTNIPCLQCAVERSFMILEYVHTDKDQIEDICDNIKEISFIPIMSKPKEWPVKWEGDNCSTKEQIPCSRHRKKYTECLAFAPPTLVYSPELKRMCGSICLIHGLGEQKCMALKEVFCRLGVIIEKEKLPVEHVVNQLTEYCSNASAIGVVQLKDLCFDIYRYLDRKARASDLDLSYLNNQKILLTRHGLVESSLFSIDDCIDCPPELFSVQNEGLSPFIHLIKSLGITAHFRPEKVLQILLQKRMIFHESKLPIKEVLLMSKLLNLLFSLRNQTQETLLVEDLYLPNSESVLCPIKDLCIDDGINLGTRKFNFLHPKISFSQEILNWLGVVERKRKRYLESRHKMRFGQKEPLATRLRNILNDYPCDSGVMKELLQNADDAGATEIAFIKDFRTHSKEKLFHKLWAPLQGPALCVYNNSCFTCKDLEGIQNLGNSVKIQDPASTGQYGIGFNAVYHLTDAPSFLTRGKSVPGNETLCLFDPLCKYDPDSTSESPGAQLTDLDDLRGESPDSFAGYLEDTGLLKAEGTIFRLPLRTDEKSVIGNKVTESDVSSLLQEFISEMKLSLLFLKNVNKISICSIAENGELRTEYCVNSCIAEEKKLCELKELVKNRKALGDCSDVNYFRNMGRVSYKMTITDTIGYENHWLIVQQVGSCNESALPEQIEQAFEDKCLRLLPQASVAVSLRTNVPFEADRFKVFCFLPLAIQSGLPFCVNGHFALDTSRRSLWVGTSDFKAEWNIWLLRTILVPAAVEAISEYRQHLFDKKQNFVFEEYEKIISDYYNVLPDMEKATAEQWKKFIPWFYECVKDRELPFFDVFIPEDDIKRGKAKGKLAWHALQKFGDGFPIYFTKDIDDSIQSTLKRLGMKIGSLQMLDLLNKAKISVEMVNGENVLEFLLSWNSNHPDRCRPAFLSDVKDTPFLSIENVCRIFKYILSVKNCQHRLNQLPLLVRMDLTMGHFDDQNTIFCSKYGHLLPECKHEFLHGQLVEIASKEKCLQNGTKVIKPFTLVDFSDRLPTSLSANYKSQDVKLETPENSLHGRKWLISVWNFITEQLQLKFNYLSPRGTDWERAKYYLIQLLGDWALYPITSLCTEYVIPIKNASRALYGSNEEIGVFSKLPIPRCHTTIIIPRYLRLPSTLENPTSVLEILYQNRKEIALIVGELSSGDLNKVLEYFGEHCENFFLSKENLRAMKLYKIDDGQICNLEREFVTSFSPNLLCWIKTLCVKKNIVILKPSKSSHIQRLYTYLSPEGMMCDLNIFLKLILPNFSLLQESEHMGVLSILRDRLDNTRSKTRELWNHKEKNVVAKLRETPFIAQNGNLLTANRFYDPFHPVFIAMNMSKLPDVWKEREWQYFLQLAGMIHELTGEMFVECAKSLSITDPSVKMKSEVLVDYLISHFDALKPSVEIIRKIEFLVPKKRRILEEMCPYYETRSQLMTIFSSAPSDLENLLWTTVSLLPEYANRLSRKAGLGIHAAVPLEEFYSHVRNLTSTTITLGEGKELKIEDVENVMDCIYEHLNSKCESNFLLRFKESGVPVIHLKDKGKFVTVDEVVEELPEEVEPYLYKAPITYGRYFKLFSKLGVSKKANCDHYIQILEKIHDKCQIGLLTPEESRCMKVALENLSNRIKDFPEITSKVLYLPTRDNKLVKSLDMYVSDNAELERETEGRLDKPLFVGLARLNRPIIANDLDFVNNLPEKLKPKFLSEVIIEVFDKSSSQEEDSPHLHKIKDLIYSEEFQYGVIRLLNHYQFNTGNCLSSEEMSNVEEKLKSVVVKAVKEISISLEIDGKKIGAKSPMYQVQKVKEHSDKVIFYISLSKIKEAFIPEGLYEAYRTILDIETPDKSVMFMGICTCIGKPENIDEYLNNKNIKAFGEVKNEMKLYQTDVGTYLHKDFIPLLDNEFCKFHCREIVAMKKYVDEDINSEEDFIYIIVQVIRQVNKATDNVMFDEYEVNTGENENPNIILKAHQLYKFVRKDTNANKHDNVPSSNVSKERVEEELSEEEIMKAIRKQMRDIWQEKDEKVRRHLIRRLILKCHPDKNMDKVDLYTRVSQYIQTLIGRLERGETIPDEEDHKSSKGTPSGFYKDTFNPPPWFYNSGSQSHSFSGSQSHSYSGSQSSSFRNNFNRSRFSHSSSRRQQTKMSDRPEARRWLKQAQHDLNESLKKCERSPCWAVFMCYQAAEKALKAALFVEDCERAREIHIGPHSHELSFILREVTSNDLTTVVEEMNSRVGRYDNMQYPSTAGVPCDFYTEDDASFMLEKTNTLLQRIQQMFY